MSDLIITLTVFVLTTAFAITVSLLCDIPTWFILLTLILMWVAWWAIGDD